MKNSQTSVAACAAHKLFGARCARTATISTRVVISRNPIGEITEYGPTVLLCDHHDDQLDRDRRLLDCTGVDRVSEIL